MSKNSEFAQLWIEMLALQSKVEKLSKQFDCKGITFEELKRFSDCYYKVLSENNLSHVDIDTFITSDEYLGRYFNSKLNGKSWVYPYWRRKLRDIYSPTEKSHDVIRLCGEDGTGKTTASMIGVLYDLYLLMNGSLTVQEKYGLPSHKTVAVAVLTQGLQGSCSYYNTLSDIICASPYFSKQIASFNGNTIRFKGNIVVRCGSSLEDPLGTFIIAYVADDGMCALDKVLNVINNLKCRREARFGDLHNNGIVAFKSWELRNYEPKVKTIITTVRDVREKGE